MNRYIDSTHNVISAKRWKLTNGGYYWNSFKIIPQNYISTFLWYFYTCNEVILYIAVNFFVSHLKSMWKYVQNGDS